MNIFKAILFILATATFAGVFLTSEGSSEIRPHVILLSEKNTVSLSMPIDGASAAETQQALMQTSSKLRPSETLYLTLNSPGGSVTDGEKIIETALGLPNKVSTISIFSASMSFIISQYLDKRYVLESGTMMSHRAAAQGIGGQIPGNLITRALGLLSFLDDMDAKIAVRAGMTKPDYQRLISDELWMRGQQAVDKRFADEVVRVRCDKSLEGNKDPKTFNTLFGPVNVTWAKCPLITEPVSIEAAQTLSKEDVQSVGRLFSTKHYHGTPSSDGWYE